MRTLVALSVGLVLAGTLDSAAPPTRAPRFDSDILPLLQARCVRCHGPRVRRAELRLDSLAALLEGGESGPAVIPGKPEQSPLYEKIHSGVMPPAKKDRLDARETDRIRDWIARGISATRAEVNQHDVLPILLRRCTTCHGPRRREAGLDLRTRAGMLKGGKSGPAIVPGDPAKSLLLDRIRTGAMPPRHRLVEASVKPIEAAEVEVLTRWIAQGATESPIEPDVASTSPDRHVRDRDRDFWAFKVPLPVAVPDVKGLARVRNPIDAFVLRQLEARGLTLSPEADRPTLLRRVSFDLTGLPPTPQQVSAFLADRSPDAYERLVGRLLASPRHGERWARYWLDVAGYADSEGKREQDLHRPHAWRYRDYVIRSLDDDKGYDRFLLEQIAGDELADADGPGGITPEIHDNLVATGFLRMVPDATWANITGFVPDRIEVIADAMDVLGSGVMGLTMKCARCHGHKFDPIPQRDYYRLLDVFKGAYDEYDWLKPDVRPGIGPVSTDVFAARLLPFGPRTDGKAGNRLRIQALWDRGDPSPTYVYRRGDPSSPGRLVGPGVPSVLTDGRTPFVVRPPWPGAKKTGRRLAFARWLTQPGQPLTARVMVNRIWKHHFGTGLVRTLGNFGKAGARPSHPELLDWLAGEFVRGGWSLKQMHRLILTSATYRQQSAITADHEKRDPENVLLSRMPLTRLDAEALYDSLVSVAGQLDETRFGPGDRVQTRADGLATPTGTARGWRRLIYVEQRRKQLPTHLENFDYPQMNPNCLERRDSTVAPQALYLMNNGMVRRLAEELARRVLQEVGDDPTRQIEHIHLVCLGRPATAEERAVSLASLETLAALWRRHLGKVATAETVAMRALTGYCHTMVNAAEFLHVD